MTIEDIQLEANAELAELDSRVHRLMEKVSSLCMGEGNIGELDDVYREVKQCAKKINRLAKNFAKLKGE